MRCAWCLSLVCPLLLAPALGAQTKLEESRYYPLQVGTAWHYLAGENKFTVRVAKHEKVGDVLCARLEYVMDGKVTVAEDVGLTGEGLCRFRYDGKDVKPPFCFLKLPPRKDQTWKVESKLDDQTIKGTFKSGEEEVKVPAGTYRTVTVTGQDLEAGGMKLSLTYYFAEDVGPVKQVIETAGAKIEIVLEKFEQAGKQ